MPNNYKEKRPIRPTLKTMELNQVEIFPIIQRASVLSCLYSIGVIYDKRFSVKTNRVARNISVTRVK